MKRVVEPELLDALPALDPDALRSRRDIRRLNLIMRHESLFRAALKQHLKNPPKQIVEIASGDGSMMLKLAERMHREWKNVSVTLVDMKPVVSRETLARFSEFGWEAEAVAADVFDWLPDAKKADAFLVNLFLHHWSYERLAQLFNLIAARTELFVACETSRDVVSRAASHLVGFVGCGPITRHDAVKSTYAGFIGDELSQLWPEKAGWQLSERRVRMFTHKFVAQHVA